MGAAAISGLVPALSSTRECQLLLRGVANTRTSLPKPALTVGLILTLTNPLLEGKDAGGMRKSSLEGAWTAFISNSEEYGSRRKIL